MLKRILNSAIHGIIIVLMLFVAATILTLVIG